MSLKQDIKRTAVIVVIILTALWLFVDESAWRWLARSLAASPRPATVSAELNRPLENFRPSDNRDLVERFRNQGIDLECYVPTERAHRITEEDTFVCWGWIRAAWGIPAKVLTLFFNEKGLLNYVRVEFPAASFGSLKDHIESLEQTGSCFFHKGFGGMDLADQRVDSWYCPPNGLIVFNGEIHSAEPPIVLWESNRIFVADVRKRMKKFRPSAAYLDRLPQDLRELVEKIARENALKPTR